MTHFTFPEYSFEIFDTILKIIYGKEINVSTMDSEFLLNLLEASDRFKLFDKVDYLQSYLIEVRSSWIYDNIFKLIPTAFENDNFHQLKSFVIDLICKDTKWFLSLKQFNDLPENQLIKFLQINDLSIEEFHVWNAVLSWSFKRNADLNEKKNGKNKMGKINSSDISYFIHNCNDCGPCFGTTDLWITPKEAHSDEHNIAYQPLSNFGYHRKDCYDIELREEPGGFQIVDYEVFQVVHV
uniref:BACK domain-containing protein n=1 Tax=Rhizophagus irregularis (strain DAOM 181602 / DAOM 197198 / MUCL 43194) TaxID=747089 RepID=U9TPI6_RHIID